MHAQFGIDHRHLVVAHLAGTAGVIGALTLAGDEVEDLLVGPGLLVRELVARKADNFQPFIFVFFILVLLTLLITHES